MKRTLINNKWSVMLPDHRAGWDAWSNWEPTRFDSMAEKLLPGMTLFDIGAEQGDMSAVYAQFVGGENMCLFEPHPEVWVNIRKTWEANELATPKGCYAGLVGETSNETPPALDFKNDVVYGWPDCAWRDELHLPTSFRYIHEHVESTPQISIDNWCLRTEIFPRAITIDVEGAELGVLKGAGATLIAFRPLVWVSIHPDLMEKHYNTTKQQLLHFMGTLGYRHTHLGTDHEEHHLFE